MYGLLFAIKVFLFGKNFLTVVWTSPECSTLFGFLKISGGTASGFP